MDSGQLDIVDKICGDTNPGLCMYVQQMKQLSDVEGCQIGYIRIWDILCTSKQVMSVIYNGL